ncbi:hypothetical protein F9B52_09470 [Staphylococcus epidermidis]|nr:hypothetical protein F6I04_06815 [Staphylococcus epidermidis]KAA9312977.1 hypothetical protein F6H98_12080 [Staphylococcus epidermidis]KAB2191194.1 hypothetical protein F9B24_08720 [Staphylococcus epidermidis]KAB2259358.1 hypothetical protein F9B56_11570 [Staphylococcus epidermidis]KAB2271923.1 hypothetical protein F9B52_09470 [Staphylococcus epidermidis]
MLRSQVSVQIKHLFLHINKVYDYYLTPIASITQMIIFKQ